jgi:hypothetical protein
MIIKAPAISNKFYQDSEIPAIKDKLAEIRSKYGRIIDLVATITNVPVSTQVHIIATTTDQLRIKPSDPTKTITINYIEWREVVPNCGKVSITNNQINHCKSKVISIIGNSRAQNGLFVISGNTVLAQQSAAKSLIELSGVVGAVVTGNVFWHSSPADPPYASVLITDNGSYVSDYNIIKNNISRTTVSVVHDVSTGTHSVVSDNLATPIT